MGLPAPAVTPRARESNLTVSARMGTTITASGTIHVKGAYTTLIAATAHDAFGVWVSFAGLAVSAAASNALVDIAIGAAGSEQVILPNLDAGNAQTSGSHPTAGALYFFPVFIPSGERVAARMQALIASDTAVVMIYLDQRPLYPPATGGVVDYGTNLSLSRGTSVARANGAFGAWAELVASTSRDHRFWKPGIDGLSDATLTGGLGNLVQLGVGGAGAEQVIEEWSFGTDTSEAITGSFPPSPVYCPVPAGSRIAARACGSVTEPLGVIAYGVD